MKEYKSFDEFWKDYTEDLDVWSMGLEEYNHHKEMAKKIWMEYLGR